jgi:hypothetical protein
MRPRVSSDVALPIRQLALSHALSESAMTTRLIRDGLRHFGVIASAPAVEQEATENDCRMMTVKLGGEARAAIKRLAASEDRSNRSMVRRLIEAGLRQYGWQPPIAQHSTCSTGAEAPLGFAADDRSDVQ